MQAAIQTALYARLNGASLGVSIYDRLPQHADGGDGTDYPAISMGRIIFTEDDTQTTDGGAFVCRIHTYVRGGSMLACKTIQDAIYAALHRQELTVTGHNNFSLLRTDTDCTYEQDGRVHGICEFRGLIETA